MRDTIDVSSLAIIQRHIMKFSPMEGEELLREKITSAVNDEKPLPNGVLPYECLFLTVDSRFFLDFLASTSVLSKERLFPVAMFRIQAQSYPAENRVS